MLKIRNIAMISLVLMALILPAMALKQGQNYEQLGSIGNIDRTYEYQGTTITCYLGHLAPGLPVYFCMWSDGGMDHSFLIKDMDKMNAYYGAGSTTTFTFSGRP